MTLNKRVGIIFFACAVMVACAIFAWRAHRTLSATTTEHARFLAQIAALTTRLRAVESDLAQAKADWKDEQAATTASDKAAIRVAQLAQNMAIYDAAMKRLLLGNDPKFQQVYYKALQTGMERTYSPLIAFIDREHFAPDQTARLKKALMQRVMDQGDLWLALQAQGLADDDPSGIEIKQQFEDTFQQTVKDIVGPESYARIATYDRQNSIWSMMGSYAVASTGLGSPVPYDQVAQMVDYIARNNPDYQDGKAVNEYARTIMTPEQFDLFTHLTARDATQQKLNRAFDTIVEASKQNADTAPSR